MAFFHSCVESTQSSSRPSSTFARTGYLTARGPGRAPQPIFADDQTEVPGALLVAEPAIS